MNRLSIKALIVAAFGFILVMGLAATVSVLFTDDMMRTALERHEHAVKEMAAEKSDSAAVDATHRELGRVIALSTSVTLTVRFVALLIGLLLAVVVYRRIARMVGTTEDFAGRIERGDFATRFAADADDETAKLAVALNRMVDRLRGAAEREAAANRRLGFLVEASPVIIYAARADGVFGTNFISSNVGRLLGHAPADFIGDAGFWLNHLHPDDRERVLARQADLFATGRVASEYRFRHRDGSWRWMRDEATLTRDAENAPLEIVGSWLDITQRKQMEESIARRDAILSAVAYGSARFLVAGAEASPAQWKLAVEAVLSHLGEATGVSRIWIAENSTTAEGDLRTRPIHLWAMPEFAVPLADPQIEEGVSYQGEGMGVEALRMRLGELLQLRTVDLPAPLRGRFERLEIRAELLAPITVGDQWWGFMAFDDCVEQRSWTEADLEALRAAANLLGAAIAARGHREKLRASMETLGSALEKLKRQSAEIERQNAELTRASRAKSEFMNSVTHELRTPLNSVIGFAELLKEEVPGPLNEKQARFVADILAGGQRLLELVEGILAMSRLDANGIGLEREPVAIGAALADRIAAHRQEAARRGVTLSLDLTPDVASAALDPQALRRMLDALLDNAIKFNREGGSVAIGARRDGEWIEIALADSGIGIAAADLERIFLPLHQLDTGLERQHGGVGLGLALARRLAEMHGGTLTVASEPGQGSVFTLRLPDGQIPE